MIIPSLSFSEEYRPLKRCRVRQCPLFTPSSSSKYYRPFERQRMTVSTAYFLSPPRKREMNILSLTLSQNINVKCSLTRTVPRCLSHPPFLLEVQLRTHLKHNELVVVRLLYSSKHLRACADEWGASYWRPHSDSLWILFDVSPRPSGNVAEHRGIAT